MMSHLPSDTGFYHETLWPTAIAQNIMPPDVNRITTSNGKIYAYVRFDNVIHIPTATQLLDLSEIPENDIIMNGFYTSVFIKCEVDENYVFVNQATFFSPRV